MQVSFEAFGKAAHGQMLLQALVSNENCHPVLEKLELGQNRTWWSPKTDLENSNAQLLEQLVI